jgi:UDP-N-acetylglucosamine 2-epimerase (non-hydrolysing)
MLDRVTPSLPPRSVVVLLGTRPEAVKLAGIVRLLGDAARVVHTGQHWDPALWTDVVTELGLPEPVASLGIGGLTRGEQIGRGVSLVDAHLAAEPARAVVVQGDTNSTLAGALAANARGVPLAHVEAGLRSGDRAMPEEHNRILTDHVADLLLAPTETAARHLAAEGLPAGRVVVTGNTVVEAAAALLPPPAARGAVLDALGLTPDGYVLATLHRPENVDEPGPLAAALEALAGLPLPVVIALHPRTAASAERLGLGALLARLTVLPPLPYGRFLALMAEAAALVSDSGGVQEEASIVKRPVFVLRRSTERPEVLGTFATLGGPHEVGATVGGWLADLGPLHERLAATPTPYGDGTASERSVAALLALLAD